MITFLRDGSPFLAKDIPGYKAGERLGEELLLKEAEKELTMDGFLK